MLFNTPIPRTIHLPHDQVVEAELTFTGTPTNFTAHLRQVGLPRRNEKSPLQPEGQRGKDRQQADLGDTVEGHASAAMPLT